jgi:hypothetical protein
VLPAPQASWLYLLRETLCPGPKIVTVQINGRETQVLSPGNHFEVVLRPESSHRVVISGKKVRRAFDIVLEQGEIAEITFTFRTRALGDRIDYRAQPWRSQVSLVSPPIKDVSFKVVGETVAYRHLEPERRDYVNDLPQRVEQEVSYGRIWTRSFGVGGEQGWNRAGGLGLNIGWVLIQGQVERTISSQYSINLQEQISISEKARIMMPPRSRITVFWYVVEKLRRGVVQVGTARNGATYYVPYEVAESAFIQYRYGNGDLVELQPA